MLAVLAVLGVAVVLTIQGVYDLFWGSDPIRFGFWFNFATDGIGIVAYVAAGTMTIDVLGKVRLSRLSRRLSKGV